MSDSKETARDSRKRLRDEKKEREEKHGKETKKGKKEKNAADAEMSRLMVFYQAQYRRCCVISYCLFQRFTRTRFLVPVAQKDEEKEYEALSDVELTQKLMSDPFLPTSYVFSLRVCVMFSQRESGDARRVEFERSLAERYNQLKSTCWAFFFDRFGVKPIRVPRTPLEPITDLLKAVMKCEEPVKLPVLTTLYEQDPERTTRFVAEKVDWKTNFDFIPMETLTRALGYMPTSIYHICQRLINARPPATFYDLSARGGITVYDHFCRVVNSNPNDGPARQALIKGMLTQCDSFHESFLQKIETMRLIKAKAIIVRLIERSFPTIPLIGRIILGYFYGDESVNWSLF